MKGDDRLGHFEFDKLKTVAEAFRVSVLFAEFNADGVYARDDVPTAVADEIAQDMAIISERLRVAQAILDEAMPGFAALVYQAEVEARLRAKAQFQKENRRG